MITAILKNHHFIHHFKINYPTTKVETYLFIENNTNYSSHVRKLRFYKTLIKIYIGSVSQAVRNEGKLQISALCCTCHSPNNRFGNHKINVFPF